MLENLNNDVSAITHEYVIPWAINFAMAVAIFIVGRIVSRIIVNVVTRLLKSAKLDDILINFITSILGTALLLVVVIAALDQLGVDTTSLIALIGAAGLAVGLALQDSLKNFASGVMIIVFRPFKAGDFVEAAGIAGTVEQVNIFNTVFKTGDNREIIVPNGAIYGGNITNFSARPTRRIDMVFGIGYEDDMRKAKEIIKAEIEKDARVLKEPETLIAISELADSSVNIVARPWVNSGDYWAVKFDLTENIKRAFDENGVTIPYPQVEMHVIQKEKTL